MQWAVRQRHEAGNGTTSRTAGASTGVPGTTPGGIVYVDSSSLRRSTACSVPSMSTLVATQVSDVTWRVRVQPSLLTIMFLIVLLQQFEF